MRNKYRTQPERARNAGPLLGLSAVAGALAAGALTLFVDTVRHAALVKSAAQPAAGGQKLSPGFILACGFSGTFVLVTTAVFITAVVIARRARRSRQAGSTAPRRRRTAARSWQS